MTVEISLVFEDDEVESLEDLVEALMDWLETQHLEPLITAARYDNE